jgi:MioC protein
MALVKFLVGSTYGNAEQAADDAAQLLLVAGHTAKVIRNATLNDVVEDENAIIIFCTATIGQGDIPDNLLNCYEALHDASPYLANRQYGIIALGDSSYEEFAGAGYQIQELMYDLQAKPILPMLTIDAIETPDPEEVVAQWIGKLNAKL